MTYVELARCRGFRNRCIGLAIIAEPIRHRQQADCRNCIDSRATFLIATTPIPVFSPRRIGYRCGWSIAPVGLTGQSSANSM